MLGRPWMGTCGRPRIRNASSGLWSLPVGGASNAGYHGLGCAKTIALTGKAFAEAMVEMEKK